MNLLLMIYLCLVTSHKSNAQIVERGNVFIDGYYSFPNLYSGFLLFSFKASNSGYESNLKSESMGPLGLRGEYMLTDKIGLGVDLGINSSSISYDIAFQNGEVVYKYKIKTQKIGTLVSFNYHFVVDAFDMYFVTGIGYGSRSFIYTSTDPNYSFQTKKSLIPVVLKIGIGMRYFFTENIGANLALGLGQGGILSTGISVKF